MFVIRAALLTLGVACVTALPNPQNPDPVILKWREGQRYDYMEDGDGNIHLIDQWVKMSNLRNMARYVPDMINIMHLFTRSNPSLSQPFLLNSDALLAASNFDGNKRTAIIVHGWTQSATSNVNTVLVPAFLEAQDMNVIVYDWSAGVGITDLNGPLNAVQAGYSLARAIDWIISRTGARINDFHLVGFSLGAHLVGVAGRNVQSGSISYITALDPGANMEDSGHLFGPDAAFYTEAIHTNARIMGHGLPLAHVDFYPNGGDLQPGCGLVNFICNHYRSFFFFAETLTSGNDKWIGNFCPTYTNARLGLCMPILPLRMGGLQPKFGISGLYHLTTNEDAPFQ